MSDRIELIAEIVRILSTDAEDDGYDYDTVDAKSVVIKMFEVIDSGSADDIAEYIDDKGMI